MLRHSPSLIGCSVTYPHKQVAFDAVDHRTGRAERLGALNTIRRELDGSLTLTQLDLLTLQTQLLEQLGLVDKLTVSDLDKLLGRGDVWNNIKTLKE